MSNYILNVVAPQTEAHMINYRVTSSSHTYAKTLCFIVIAVLTALSLMIILTLGSVPSDDKIYAAQEGKLDISTKTGTDLFYLKGEWNYYKDVFLTPETFDESLLVGNDTVSIPYPNVTRAQGTATYKLDLKFENKKDLLLYIPYLEEPISIFLNGKCLAPIRILSPIAGTGSALYTVSNYDQNIEYQQLVISTNKNPEDSTFYERYVILAPLDSINTLIFSSSLNQFIFFSMLLIITFNGFVFMFLHPAHKIMSLITVFDALLLIFITMSLPAVLDFFTNLSPSFALKDSTKEIIQMILLMATGALGISLSKEIFDPEFKVNKKVWYDGCILLFIALCILFLWDMTIYDKYGIAILTISLGITFIGVFKRFKAYYDANGLCVYLVFQACKTVYLGVLMLSTITMQNLVIYNNLSIYNLFLLFIVLHLIMRLHDNYTSHTEVARLNTGLEAIVAERTQRLSEANAALQKSNDTLNEISIKDALTKINNRLHFERKVEELLGKFNEQTGSLYLCIFDLDFFKKINDTYGHEQGDKALIEVAAIGSEMLPKNCIFARIGGEEFAVIFIDMDDVEVLNIIDALRVKLETESKSKTYATTGSFGLSKYGTNMDSKKWFVSADKELYRAKAGGRNKIMADFIKD